MSWHPLKTALGFAAAYSLLVALGSLWNGGRTVAYLGRPMHQIIAFYFAAAILVGILAGLAARWVTNRLRAGFAGFILGLPVAFTINLVFRPEFRLEVMLIGSLLSAAILGVGYGLILWEPRRPDQD